MQKAAIRRLLPAHVAPVNELESYLRGHSVWKGFMRAAFCHLSSSKTLHQSRWSSCADDFIILPICDKGRSVVSVPQRMLMIDDITVTR